MLAVWIWADTVAREGAEIVVSRLSRAGVTDLYLLAKGQAGSACFDDCKTAYRVAWSGQDILPRAVRCAHEHGMRVHAWITSSYDAAYKKRFPESGLCHFFRGRDRSIISLRNDGYRDFMRRFVEETFIKCAPDGLHMDYIRYNHLTYGWGEEDLAAYEKRGIDVGKLRALMDRTFFAGQHDNRAIFDAYEAGDADVLALAEDRRENVATFARMLGDAARSVKPDAVLSAALMPEGAYVKGDVTQGVSAVAFAALHYGQSYPDAARLYDHVAIMSYAPTYHEDGAWVKRLAKNAMDVYGCRVVAGLQAFDAGTSLTLRDEYNAVMALRDQARFMGCALFRAGETPFCFEERHGDICEIAVENTLPRAIEDILFQPLDPACELSPETESPWLRKTEEGVRMRGDAPLPPYASAIVRLRTTKPSLVLARPFSQEGEERAWIVEMKG